MQGFNVLTNDGGIYMPEVIAFKIVLTIKEIL